MYVHGFRFYFTPVTPVLFAFPSQYWFTIGQSGVFSLGGWSPLLQTGFLVSRPTSRKLSTTTWISSTGLSPCIAQFPNCFLYLCRYHLQAPSLSLAATHKISVDFFSSGYLDVSVLPVRFLKLCIHLRMMDSSSIGFPHSDILDYSPLINSSKLFAD